MVVYLKFLISILTSLIQDKTAYGGESIKALILSVMVFDDCAETEIWKLKAKLI